MNRTGIDHSETHPGCRSLREQARDDGVVHSDNLPFLLIPEQAHIATLLVHGFTASPHEMRLLASHLTSVGHAVLAVRLPGHGTSPKDLAHRRWEEWASAVAEGHRLLAEDFSQVYGVGLSTGSLLLVNQAVQSRLNGMVLLSPYLKVKHRLAGYAGWLRYLRPYHEGLAESVPSPTYYTRRPVAGVHQINRLVRHLRPRLAQCTTPTLAINGEGDRTVDITTGRQLVEQLASPVKIHQCYGQDVPHVLTSEQNPLYQEMFEMIERFIKELDEPGEVRQTVRCKAP